MASPAASKITDAFSRARAAISGVRKDVENIRLQIAEKQLARNEVENAPISPEEIEARVDWILDTAESSATAGSWHAGWLSQPLEAGTKINIDDKVEALFERSPLGTLSIFGFRSIIRAALIEEARAGMPIEAKCYTPAEREAAIASIDAEVEALEILEERIIREAESEGVKIARREDANPAIFLRYDRDLK